jgi:hypothetical protein
VSPLPYVRAHAIAVAVLLMASAILGAQLVSLLCGLVAAS